MKKKQANIVSRLNAALDEIRPFLRQDGGDVELLEVTEELSVLVELKGTCKTCSLNSMTFTSGIEETLRKAVPQIREVISVDSND